MESKATCNPVVSEIAIGDSNLESKATCNPVIFEIAIAPMLKVNSVAETTITISIPSTRVLNGRSSNTRLRASPAPVPTLEEL